MDFSTELYQTFKQELISTLLKLFHKIQREGTVPNSFYEARITLITMTKSASSQGCRDGSAYANL
jgi:hypothetical protein